MKIYVTKQGETVDLACHRHYGHTNGALEQVLEANPGLADLGFVLPMGTRIVMPERTSISTTPARVSLWD